MIKPTYIDTHLSHGIRCAIGQIRTSSHNLEIEIVRVGGIQTEDKICQLSHIEPETELHHLCRCPVYYEIRGRFHFLFIEGLPIQRGVWTFDQSYELHRLKILGSISIGITLTQGQSIKEITY